MTRFILLPFVLTMALAAPQQAGTKIKIDTVPAEYRPSTGSEPVRPVSMESFHFEVNNETRHARVVVEYTYPHEVGYQSSGDRGPQPTVTELPGLTYDRTAHAVVYKGAGKKTVCATVQEKKSFWGMHFDVKNTGSCVVTASVAEHAEGDGWSLHRARAIDTYFEVR